MKRILVAFFLVSVCPGLVFGLSVTFKNQAEVNGPMLTIGDVAEIRPADKAAKLSGVALFSSPPAGRQKCYRSRTLKAYVMDAVSDGTSVEWGGADRVCVGHQGVQVSGNKLQSVIDQKLKQVLAHLPAERVGFKARKSPPELSLPPGEAKYRVRFSDRDVLDSRQASVIVRVDGRVVENVTVAGQVQAFMPVVVAGRKLKRGMEIKAEDLSTKPRNIAELEKPCLDVASVAGMRLKRSVALNEVILEKDLDRPVLVKRRQLVTMVLEKGPLRIKARGKAAGEGKKGDVIMVKNMRSHRQVPCKVVGPGLTKVDF
ncbi:MAG: flagellar basal body P-ring formation chaperone FlgA [Thermodesulfobacteriota bacterium]